MANEVATVESSPVPARASEVSSLVQLALEKGVAVEVLERLVALQERVTDRNAEMAMAQALAAFQDECPPIRRVNTATVTKNGVKQYDYKFAPLEEIARAIRGTLAKHGLSYSHDGAVTGNEVETVCTLRHVEGAKRTATFRGPIDTSGGKNPIQQVASARSYGRRYSLMDVLGLTTEEDDDGHGAGGETAAAEPITEGQEADLRALIREVGYNEKKLCEWLKVQKLAEIAEGDYRRAVDALERRRRRPA